VTTLIFRHSLRMLWMTAGSGVDSPTNGVRVSTGSAIRAVEPDHLVLRPRKMRSGQRFSYLALEPEETRALNAAYNPSGPVARLAPSGWRFPRRSKGTAAAAARAAVRPVPAPRFQTRRLGDGTGSGAPVLADWPVPPVHAPGQAHKPSRWQPALESGRLNFQSASFPVWP
jgi:hypothetical protein